MNYSARLTLTIFVLFASQLWAQNAWRGGEIWPLGRSCVYEAGAVPVWNDSVVSDTVVDGLTWKVVQRSSLSSGVQSGNWYVYESDSLGVWAGTVPDTASSGLLFGAWMIERVSDSIEYSAEDILSKSSRYQFPSTVLLSQTCMANTLEGNDQGGTVSGYSNAYLINCAFGTNSADMHIRYVYYGISDSTKAGQLYFEQSGTGTFSSLFPEVFGDQFSSVSYVKEMSCTRGGEPEVPPEWGLPITSLSSYGTSFSAPELMQLRPSSYVLKLSGRTSMSFDVVDAQGKKIPYAIGHHGMEMKIDLLSSNSGVKFFLLKDNSGMSWAWKAM